MIKIIYEDASINKNGALEFNGTFSKETYSTLDEALEKYNEYTNKNNADLKKSMREIKSQGFTKNAYIVELVVNDEVVKSTYDLIMEERK